MIKEPRNKSITVRLSEAEYSMIENGAKQNKETNSSYLRYCAIYKPRRIDTAYCRDSKIAIRNMKTSFNMIEQKIDVENQKEKIFMEAKKLCSMFH